jgi:hypothetical protein
VAAPSSTTNRPAARPQSVSREGRASGNRLTSAPAETHSAIAVFAFIELALKRYAQRVLTAATLDEVFAADA